MIPNWSLQLKVVPEGWAVTAITAQPSGTTLLQLIYIGIKQNLQMSFISQNSFLFGTFLLFLGWDFFAFSCSKPALVSLWWLSSVKLKYKPGYRSCDLLEIFGILGKPLTAKTFSLLYPQVFLYKAQKI